MEKKVFIYGLTDPRTDEIRYVGWTVDIDNRYKEHIRQSKYEKSHKANWIRSVVKESLNLGIIVLDKVPEEDWALCENAWILYGFEQGWPLTNGTLGGDGTLGREISEEHKQRLREIMKGNKYSLGVKASEETRKLLSQQRKGNKHALGMKHTEESRRKMSEALTGRKHTEDTKNKIKIAQQGEKSHLAKLTEKQVIEILQRVSIGETQTYIAKQYGVARTTINMIVNGKNWAHINRELK